MEASMLITTPIMRSPFRVHSRVITDGFGHHIGTLHNLRAQSFTTYWRVTAHRWVALTNVGATKLEKVRSTTGRWHRPR